MRQVLRNRRWIARALAPGRGRRTTLVAGGIVAATLLALSPVSTPPAYADSTAVSAMFYEQAASHRLWLIGRDRVPTDAGVGVAPDSSPAGVQAPGSTDMVVFKRDSDGLLWEIGLGHVLHRVGTGFGVAAGTSPAVTRRGTSNVIAFQAAGTGNLWYVDDADQVPHDTGIKMAPGTSPAITTTNAGSGVAIVFKNNADGLLYRLDPGFDLRFAGNGLGVAAGTSPSIAPSTLAGHFEVAFQANGSGDLWWVDENNIGHDTGIKMAPNTSPAIALLDNGQVEIAFKRDSDGLLWTFNPATGPLMAANGLGVAAGTSPAITQMTGGRFAIAFQAAGFGDLWIVDANNTGRDTGVTVQPGTSPTIILDCAVNCAGGGSGGGGTT